MEILKDYTITRYDETCSEHLSPAVYALRLDGTVIFLCQDCLDDLYKELGQHVTQGVKES